MRDDTVGQTKDWASLIVGLFFDSAAQEFGIDIELMSDADWKGAFDCLDVSREFHDHALSIVAAKLQHVKDLHGQIQASPSGARF